MKRRGSGCGVYVGEYDRAIRVNSCGQGTRCLDYAGGAGMPEIGGVGQVDRDSGRIAPPRQSHTRVSRRRLLRWGGVIGLGVATGGLLTFRARTASGFRRGVNLAGAEFNPEQLPGSHGQHYFYPAAESLDYYGGKGLALVRVPCRWERLQRAPFSPLDRDELALLDAVIAAAGARKMTVIIDIHNFARYRGAVIGTVGVPYAAFADLWRRVAERYRDEPAVWAYGLMNEPHDTDGRWPTAAQAAVDAIRSVDREHRLLVSGDAWSTASSWRQDNETLRIADPTGNIMYEAHQYFDEDGTGRYRATYDEQGAYPDLGIDRVLPFSSWLEQHRLSGFISEYGVPGGDARWLTVLERFLAHLDERRIGATYWAGGQHWGEYPLSVEPSGGADRPQMAVLARHPSR